MRVLILGSGGREHALAWSCSAGGHEVFTAPGNAGTATLGENRSVSVTDPTAVARLAGEVAPDLVVVGPDAALEAGVADACDAAGIAVFGPTQRAARIETSKAFAKAVMEAAGVPTAAWVEARRGDESGARRFIDDCGGRCVVKADGLALGKGVTVCASVDEARAAVAEALSGRFGAAGERVIVEERLEGDEVSVFALCDGERSRLLAPARDHKRAYDGDAGPNTGGMGAAAPVAGQELLAEVDERVVQPVLAELRRRDCAFRGCLYAGLMRTASGLRVLEFNARFGDPEAQVVLPLCAEDPASLLASAAAGHIEPGVAARSAGAAVAVVVAAAGYPSTGSDGIPIHFPSAGPGQLLFQAGTRREGDETVTAGGRIAAAVGLGNDVAAARRRAYELARGIEFDGIRYRRDIAEALIEEGARD